MSMCACVLGIVVLALMVVNCDEHVFSRYLGNLDYHPHPPTHIPPPIHTHICTPSPRNPV